jgi:hypothetical protein
MRFGNLRSIAHNIADSLASGCSELIGIYGLNVFREAASSPERFVEVDFLSGTAAGGPPSPALSLAIGCFRETLPDLCRKHGVPETAFRQLRVRYELRGLSATFVVTVEDINGKIATDTYVGTPGARPRVLDDLGRIRTARPPVYRASR